MGLVAALGLGAGILLVVVAWTKRDERWASSVFWVGKRDEDEGSP